MKNLTIAVLLLIGIASTYAQAPLKKVEVIYADTKDPKKPQVIVNVRTSEVVAMYDGTTETIRMKSSQNVSTVICIDTECRSASAWLDAAKKVPQKR